MDARRALRAWLRLQTLVMGGFAALFGLVFPVLGAVLWVAQVSPSGDDPAGPALAMACVGPVTALLYLPGAVLPVWAVRRLDRDPDTALVPVILAIAGGALLCGALSALPLGLAVAGHGDAEPA